jgi:hemerythrin-like metal-binding protein
MSDKWNDLYNTGISRFDNINKKIVNDLYLLSENISQGIEDAKNHELFKKIIHNMIDLWLFEENLMEEMNYDKLDVRLKVHSRLWNMIKKLNGYFESNVYLDNIDLFKDLREEFLNHIDFDDKKFSKYLNEQGYEQLDYV